MEAPDVGLLKWLDSRLIKDVNGTITIYPQLTLIVFFFKWVNHAVAFPVSYRKICLCGLDKIITFLQDYNSFS